MDSLRSLGWWFSISNNLESLNPVHVTLKLFGVMIYTVVDRVNCRLEVTLGDWILVAIYATSRIYGMFDGFANQKWQMLIESDLPATVYGMAYTIFFIVLMMTVMPFYLLLLHRRYEHLLQLLDEFDLETTGYFLISPTALAIIFAITFISRDYSYVWDTVLFLAVFTISCFASMSQHSGLNVMILAIDSRMQLMNRVIRTMLEPTDMTVGQQKDLVMKLAKSFDRLCDATENVNLVLCAPNFFNFINIFFLHVIACYACTRVFLNQAAPKETTNSLLYLSWSGFFNLFVFQTITFAAGLRRKTANFAGAVHRCLNQPHNRSIIDRLQQLSEQIDNREPVITFFLFELQPSLIIQAASELATYMLILIQFEMQ
ncbi:uncharacterized protein LOC131428621 [Malaya genurostris]|uniref:uncharacterized protein LOC131428621 n=1 Tax=Malaya genurostris TaxID=325434 RepID=UPI0026F3F443|nr:uncharacterized protein LOC131428621 [Malaya genurostris]